MRRAAFLVVAALGVAACATPRVPVPLEPDDARPARWLAEHRKSVLARHAMRGRAHLVIEGEVRARGRQVVVAERPARLRVEVLGLLNQTAAVIATDGERFEVFRVEDRSYATGEATADLLWREASIALTPSETVELLLGGPLVDRNWAPARAVGNVGEDGGWVRMDLEDAAGRIQRRIAFDSEGRMRELVTIDPDGAPRWSAVFGDFEPVDGTPFAHSIALDFAAGEAHVEISLRDVELDPELSPAVFRLREPADTGAPEGRAD